MKYFHLALALSAFVMLSADAEAAVVTDGTMGAATRLSGPDYNVSSTLGQTRGSNLFHSFSNFSIEKGESVTFGGPASITNIISRVTGGQASSLDGRISSTIAGANLYLVNPSGIMFGPNATLDVSGSFHATTADYLKLGDAGRFDARTPSNTVLTVDPPSAFGFLGPNPAPITVADSRLSIPGTLTFAGGDITISNETKQSGRTLSAGGLNIISVGSAGEATVADTGIETSTFSRMGTALLLRNADLGPPPEKKDADIDTSGGRIFISAGSFIVDGARVASDTSGGTGGTNITIQGRDRVLIWNNGSISAFGAGKGGDVTVKSDAVTIANSGEISSNTNGSADGGSITIESSALNISDGRISVLAYDKANTGTITIRSDYVSLSNNGRIYTENFSNGGTDKKSGDVSITANRVIVSDSIISSATKGTKNAGAITIRSSSLLVEGDKGVIYADSIGDGRGGNITVTSNALTVRNGGQIATYSDKRGDSGNIDITTNDLILQRGNRDGTIATAALSGSEGHAGDINITARDRVLISSGSYVTSGTSGGSSGEAGNVTISGGAAVTVENEGVITSQSLGSGQGGQIHIKAPTLTIDAGLIGTSRGRELGHSGTITISGDNVSLSNKGLISSANRSKRRSHQDAGDISITASGTVTVSGYSEIVSDTHGSKKAGDITINAPTLIVDGAVDNKTRSQISAVTLGSGRGGDISVNSEAVTVRNGGRIYSDGNTAGDAGSINITTGNLTVQNQGHVTSNSFSRGAAGKVSIYAKDTVLIADGSYVASETGRESSGEEGSITITGGSAVTVKDAEIASQALGKGHGGKIDITTPTLTVDGGIIRSNTDGTGEGGTITVNAAEILITNSWMKGHSDTGAGSANPIPGLSLTASERGSISATSSSTGNAGKITLDISNRFVMDGGSITTEAAKATGGNITIDPAFAYMRDSSISTSVNGGMGNGGNVTMAAGSFVLEGSKIKADAFQGSGGSVGITANVYLADTKSSVTASSQLGLPGVVDINAPLVDVSGNLISLPEGMLQDDLAPRTCAGSADSASSFTVGKASLQYRPERDLLAF